MRNIKIEILTDIAKDVSKFKENLVSKYGPEKAHEMLLPFFNAIIDCNNESELDADMAALRRKFPDIDYDAVGPDGLTFERRSLKIGIELGISYRAAFKQFRETGKYPEINGEKILN
jgi:hypothetical protein